MFSSNIINVTNISFIAICENKMLTKVFDCTVLSPHGVIIYSSGHLAQLVTCLAADPWDASLIPAQSHTFVEIDHEIISSAILHSRSVVVYKRKYVQEVLVNRLVKLAQEKVWLGELNVPT